MNKLNLMLVACLLFACISCRETATEGKPGDTMNGTTPSGDTTSSVNDNSAADGVVTYKQGDMDNTGVMNQDMSQTYSELEMSDDQIKTYQSNVGDMQSGAENGNQGEGQDKAMKSILTDVQYDKYKMMKKNAPKDGDQ